MTYDTRGAVSLEVLKQGNMVLSANDVDLDHPWQTSAKFLYDDERILIADSFNGGPSQLFHGDGLDGSRFVSWCPYDVFLFNLANFIQTARFGRQVPRRYVILNNEDQRSTGQHWVTVVYGETEVLGVIPARLFSMPRTGRVR